ncbi:MAG: hypothetical protein JO222_06255 [Frankiales bacterium]|nr:hypothetical protein [Frankiales bacterium]
MAAYVTVLGLLLLALAFCVRLARWYRRERRYWEAARDAIQRDPSLERLYGPLVAATREHEPPLWRRALGWQAPEVRLARSGQ